MKTIKGLFLGSAAGLLAMGGAQAADLPVKAKAVEYVKICSLYGAGFYYMPGTDTCLKIGGYVRAEMGVGQVRGTGGTVLYGDTGLRTRSNDQFFMRGRANINFDTRQQTEYGLLRTYINLDVLMSTSNPGAPGSRLRDRRSIRTSPPTASAPSLMPTSSLPGSPSVRPCPSLRCRSGATAS